MSSGQPIKTESDANRFMNEWLEVIRLEARQNQQNLDANKLYAQTGQLPPITQMADTRSIEEKLADVEGMKLMIINKLREVAEPAFAAEIVNGVINSPLNIDNKLFRFFANNIQQFVDTLKKRYGVGIRGDTSDVIVMVNFINSLYSETANTLKSVSDYAKSTTNANMSANVLSVNDIRTILLNLKDIIKRLVILRQRNINVDALNDVMGRLELLRNVMPVQDDLTRMIDELKANEFEGNINGLTNYDILDDFFKLLERLPKPNLVYTQLDILSNAINNDNDATIIDAIIRIYGLFAEILKPEFMVLINNAGNILRFLQQKDARQQAQQQAQQQVQQQAQQQPQIDGNGIKKRRGRPVGRGLMSYKSLGDVEINMNKLDKGISTIRRKTKSNYPDMPSKKISPKLKNIINTIVGGGIPKFNDLSGLDDDEKKYLHKLVKKSNLEDRLSVPTPSKDQEEIDVYQFELMKGQIMSGNDNKDMVKKFKALMLKLTKQGLLPRNEVIELMDDLNMLGY